ncbi:IPT/TIG domain-containing protein, partial [Candidatus Uhrbacteria bacterium]|nr:IPT/TIG domain-containing protein [Candidatus Uhrbacteria bacterium]
SGSATVTVDNLSPSGATATSGTDGEDAQATLNWTTSSSSDFSRSVVLRWTGASAGAEVPAEGTDYSNGNAITTATVVCVRTADAASTAVSGVDGAGTGGCSATALTNGQAYTYKAFQKDSNGNYDVGVLIGTFTPVASGPDATSYVNDTEGALDSSACATTGCGGRIGQSVTLTGTTFGTVSVGSRANCAGGAGTGCLRIANYTVPDGSVTAWTATSITFTVPAAISVFAGAGATCGAAGSNGLCVTAAGVNDTSGALEFFVYPDITSISPSGSGEAKEGDSITITGTRFDATQGTVIFQNCAGSDQTATVGSWADTSISVTVPSGIADNDDSCDIKVTRAAGTGSKTVTSTAFTVLPDITSISVCTDCVINGAREHASGVDTDGLIMLNGKHFGTSQGVNGAVEFTGGFGTVNAPIHGTAEGACATSGWAAAGTSICVEVSPSISNSAYTGTVTLTRNDFKTNVWTDFRILPRITSNAPTSGIITDLIQLTGNHFCQSGTCPVSPNRSNSTDNVKFGSTQALDGDFVTQTGGAGACDGAGAAWAHGEICVKVPAGTPTGSQPTKVRSGAGACPGATCYESNIKGFTVLTSVPDDLTSPLQYKSDGSTAIPVGTGTNETAAVFKASMSASINSTLCLQVENAAVATAFNGTVTAQEGGGGQEACKSYTGTPVTGVVTLTGLADGTSYHWRARVKNNATGETSNWVSYDPGAVQDENPPTNPASTDYYVDASGPVISSVCAVNPAASSCDGSTPTDIEAQIRWTTNESANEQVAYGTTCPTGQASAAATFTALTNKKPASPGGSGTTHAQSM